MSVTHIYKAIKVDSPETLYPGLNVNDFCFLHSGQYEKITGQKKCDSDNNDPDLYLAVKSQKRTIYLKYHSGKNTAGSAGLSYNNLVRLGLYRCEAPSVTVTKSNYFMFMWMNGDSNLRLTFRLSIIGAITGFVSIFFDVLTLVL